MNIKNTINSFSECKTLDEYKELNRLRVSGWYEKNKLKKSIYNKKYYSIKRKSN